tara:strand:- start:58 stop:543 length:486 start_codon:yes stop_codon:yes gene_type:complete
MAQNRGGGKPRKITQTVKNEIVVGMAQGSMLVDLCEQHKVSRDGVWRARQADIDFDRAFEQAACNGITVALEAARKNLETATSRDDILKCKELLRHSEWMAEKRLAIFQPATRAEITHNGPMVVGWKTIEGTAENIFSGDQVNGPARMLSQNEQLENVTAP